MSKPIIAITPQYDSDNDKIWIRPLYEKCITLSGGIPLLLPLFADKSDLEVALNLVQGVLFTGGPDITPFIFNEEAIEGCGNISPERDKLEKDVYDIAFDKKLPILGICRGMQAVNVFSGGDIFQDINSQIDFDVKLKHCQEFKGSIPVHYVDVRENSLLYEILGDKKIKVNSFHHQAVRKLGNGFKIVGISSDGIIEAIEMENYKFLLGVQWHPELMLENGEYSLNIFKAFIEACRGLK